MSIIAARLISRSAPDRFAHTTFQVVDGQHVIPRIIELFGKRWEDAGCWLCGMRLYRELIE